jgi:hypothetical protein
MAALDPYRRIVEEVLRERSAIPYSHGQIHDETVFDRQADRYVLVTLGWDGQRRVHGCLVHVDIIDGKVWIQQDGTEDGIAGDLERAGIPRSHIVLAFHPAEIREHTGYAVA